jgi:hypothetical protein
LGWLLCIGLVAFVFDYISRFGAVNKIEQTAEAQNFQNGRL